MCNKFINYIKAIIANCREKEYLFALGFKNLKKYKNVGVYFCNSRTLMKKFKYI